MNRIGKLATGAAFVAALLTLGPTGASNAAPPPHHGYVYVHTYQRGSAPVAAAPVTSKLVASGSVVHPNGCQGTVSTMTLETTARGYNYDCSGYYTDSAGKVAYHLFTGNWSGILYTYSGGTEYDYYYCDGASISIPNRTVVEIWLSATRTSWC